MADQRIAAAREAIIGEESGYCGPGWGSCGALHVSSKHAEDLAGVALAAADEADRVAGVVRVDTRDETLIDRLARVLCDVDQFEIEPPERRETMEQTGSGEFFRGGVIALFNDLLAAAGVGEQQGGQTDG